MNELKNVFANSMAQVFLPGELNGDNDIAKIQNKTIKEKNKKTWLQKAKKPVGIICGIAGIITAYKFVK